MDSDAVASDDGGRTPKLLATVTHDEEDMATERSIGSGRAHCSPALCMHIHVDSRTAPTEESGASCASRTRSRVRLRRCSRTVEMLGRSSTRLFSGIRGNVRITSNFLVSLAVNLNYLSLQNNLTTPAELISERTAN